MFVPLSPCQTCSPAQIEKSFWLHKYSSGPQKVRVYICSCSTHQVIRPAKRLKMSKRPSSVTTPLSRQSSMPYMADEDDATILLAEQQLMEPQQSTNMYDYQSTPPSSRRYPTSSSWPPSSYKYLTETPDAMILMPQHITTNDDAGDTRMVIDLKQSPPLPRRYATPTTICPKTGVRTYPVDQGPSPYMHPQDRRRVHGLGVDMNQTPLTQQMPGTPDYISSNGSPRRSDAVPEKKRKIYPPVNNDSLLPLEDQGNRFVSTSMFKNKLYISIREYYFHKKVEQWFPSGKGINLTKPQWEMLKSHASRIDAMLEDSAPIIIHV
jgi:hypothetical protein